VHLHCAEKLRPDTAPMPAGEARAAGRALRGQGETKIAAAPQDVWNMLLDPQTLASIIPGAHRVEQISCTHFSAEVTLGVGPVTGRYKADIKLSDLVAPQSVTLTGRVVGALGDGGGTGRIVLTPTHDGGTTLKYGYDAEIGGKLAAIGGRLLDGAAKLVIRQFFVALARKTGGARPGFFARLFGGRA
jgi:2-furoyl-CoA dehydrogenase large subunit